MALSGRLVEERCPTEVLFSQCCGIDVHKASLVACLRTQDGRRIKMVVREYGTTTGELLRVRAWLTEAGCTHVAMESTGIYWRPVFNVLEGACEVVLANAQHIHAVPGRKTDVRDCEWTAGVKLTCIPQRGGQRTPEREAQEKSRAFEQGQRFRAGIEGRISVLFRGRGMKRARVKGRERFETFVGAAVIANNLLVIAALLQRRAAARAARQQRRAA